MYGWIWRRLPGPTVLRSALALVLLAAVLGLLWFQLFPWLHGLLDEPTFGAPSGE